MSGSSSEIARPIDEELMAAIRDRVERFASEKLGSAARDRAALLVEVDRVHQYAQRTGQERDWLAQALADQEAAYAALEQQYLALTDAHATLVDQVSALAAEAIQ